MKSFLGLGARRQGVGAGSAYITLSFLVSGVMTYVFQSVSARVLGPEGYGELAVLWSSTFLTVQVLWIGASQTLGRYMAEREAQGLDWRPVVTSVKRLQIILLAAFVLVSLLAGPLIADGLFGGEWLLAAAFVAAVAAYAPEYFRRGEFSGHRQFSRLGALHVVESSSRALLAVVLLVAGAGVMGAAAAVVLAPLIGVLAVRPARVEPPERVGEPFGAGQAFRFAGPVLACVACAQALMNGGPILVTLLGGGREQAGLLLAALILTRAPQYVLSPVIAALLPHASRLLATEGGRGLDRFVGRAVVAVGMVGALILAGAWLFGGLGMRLLYGPDFEIDRGVLVLLGTLTAFYLLGEVLNQALFARGLARLAALGWLVGLGASLASFALLRMDVLERVSLSLALGAAVAVAAQAALYLAARRPGWAW